MTTKFLSSVKTTLVKLATGGLALGARNFCPEDKIMSWLVIAPHPDDETLGCGATIRRVRTAGHKVRVITVTDGSASEYMRNSNPDTLATQRETEMIKACKHLGLSPDDIVFLRYKDGKAQENIDGISKDITREFLYYRPQRILAPSLFDRHPDHKACAIVVHNLFKSGRISCSLFEYIIWFSIKNFIFHVLPLAFSRRLRRVATKAVINEKRNAFLEHVSQHKTNPRVDLLSEIFWSRYFGLHEIFIVTDNKLN